MAITKQKFSTLQYHLMAKAGVFEPDQRLELINGEILQMSPIGRKHAAYVARLQSWLHQNLSNRAIIWTQSSIQLDRISEPQPDLTLLKLRDDFYEERLPIPTDIFLIIEVADSTIAYDQDVKMPLYAEFDIPEIWLVDVNQEILTIYTQPSNSVYQFSESYSSNDLVSCLGVKISVSSIFGNSST